METRFSEFFFKLINAKIKIKLNRLLGVISTYVRMSYGCFSLGRLPLLIRLRDKQKEWSQKFLLSSLCLILSNNLSSQIIKLVLVLVIHGGENEAADPSQDEEGEGVEHAADEGDQIHEDAKLERLDIVIKEDEALEGSRGGVEPLSSGGHKSLNFLCGKSDLDAPDTLQGITAWLFQESHKVDIELATNTKEEDGQGQVGNH